MARHDDCFLNPTREPGEPEITGTVLLCVSPGEARSLGKLAADHGGLRHFLYNSSLWSIAGSTAYLAGPAVGAPMAALTLEKLIALGGRRFVVFGTCGAMAEGLTIGDVLMPGWAVSAEGTSRHYPLTAPTRVSAPLHDEVATALSCSGLTVKCGGCVLTTDAPFRETKELLAGYRNAGVVGIDMELSALLAVAAFRGVELAAVMVVSDLLNGQRWQSGFGSKELAEMVSRASRTLFDLCAKDSHE